MRALSIVLVAALAAVVPSAAVAGAPHAKASQHRAELVAKGVTGFLLSNGQVAVGASIKNKGTKKAPASQTTFYLSTDGSQGTNDTALGTVDVAKIRPGKAKPAAGTFTLPLSLAPGTYRVLACADTGNRVKERKETNNCKAAKGSVTVTAVRVSATAGTGGTVAASGVTAGSCAGTVCTFPSPGNGTVTFTPTPSAGYRFGAWTGGTCTGHTTGAGNAITFTRPTTSKTCTATFVKQVTISWSVANNVGGNAFGTVTATASGGTCTASGKTGSCTVDSGAGTVTLTAGGAAQPIIIFTGWAPAASATCAGVTSGPDAEVLTFTNPTSDQDCVASFSIVI